MAGVYKVVGDAAVTLDKTRAKKRVRCGDNTKVKQSFRLVCKRVMKDVT